MRSEITAEGKRIVILGHRDATDEVLSRLDRDPNVDAILVDVRMGEGGAIEELEETMQNTTARLRAAHAGLSLAMLGSAVTTVSMGPDGFDRQRKFGWLTDQRRQMAPNIPGAKMETVDYKAGRSVFSEGSRSHAKARRERRAAKRLAEAAKAPASVIKETCEYCKAGFTDTGNLRPYGRDGERICFDCGMKPENIATTEAKLEHKLTRAMDASPVIFIGGEDGPAPIL